MLRRPLVVGVPVRNEADALPRFLDAVAKQRDVPDFVLCIAFDGCDDDSAAIVAARREELPFEIRTVDAPSAEPNAGRARRCAMQLAMAHVEGDEALVVSTDADSVPDPRWLKANLAALALADIAAGRIVREAGRPSPLQDRVEAYYDALFVLRRTIDPVPWEAPRPHHYTSAASLGFRAGVYRALGGFEPRPSAEDARLVDAAHRAGYRVRRDGDIRVTTSSRRTGRAEGGLADHLRRLDGASDGATARMAHPADATWRYARHARARAAWPRIEAPGDSLAAGLGRSIAEIREIAAGSPNAEAFAMRVVPEIPGGERMVTLDVAEQALAMLCERAAVAA